MPTFQVDKNKADNMKKKSFKKVSFLNLSEDKGQFVSHDWTSLC